MQETFQQYLGIDWPARSRKPRTSGLTMVMDNGWPVTFVDSMLDQYGEYLDVVKIWDPHLRAPVKEIQRKIEAYREHDVRVQPGGIFLEIARMQGAENEVMKRLATMGFSIIEVSGTATVADRDLRGEIDFIKRARDLGFAVYGEVGKKFPEHDSTRISDEEINEDATVEEMLTLLEAGAERVYWEGHLLRRVLGETPEELLQKRNSGTPQVMRVAERVGADRIMFEVSSLRPVLSRRALQYWLMTLFGPEVNLANARLEELGYLEALRSGSHPVHGFKQAGNYPWIRAVESKQPPTYKWWEEALHL